jgi:serine/threonine-protein kinase
MYNSEEFINFDDIDKFSDFINCFENVEYLDKGGQRKVFSATHPNLGKVVIKKAEYNPKFGSPRIDRETHTLRIIDSPYYPKNFELKKFDDDNLLVIVEEFIPTLSKDEVEKYFKMNENRVIQLALDLIEGLKILWEKDIVHRDIKPDNILIRFDYKPVIIDLGVARFLNLTTLTQGIGGPGTPAYAPPEIQNYNKNLIDIRSDFFSLGVLLLEYYIGLYPFSPNLVAGNSCVENILNSNYYQLKDGECSDNFRKFIDRLLRYYPHQRFKNYEKIIEYIETNWEI